MKIQLNKLVSSFKRTVKDKRGFTLMETMFYVFAVTFLFLLLSSVVSNTYQKFISAKYQEEFYKQKNQFYTVLSKDLNTVDSDSLVIGESAKYPDTDKITFNNKDDKVEIVQTPENLIYKRTDLATNEVESLYFNFITSSDFNRIDNVCLGDLTPTDCYEVSNTIDVVVRFEKRVVKSPFSLKSGRVIYYE